MDLVQYFSHSKEVWEGPQSSSATSCACLPQVSANKSPFINCMFDNNFFIAFSIKMLVPASMSQVVGSSGKPCHS
ncbi:Hypothetical predicted protein, partial [Prunus dulcis]